MCIRDSLCFEKRCAYLQSKSPRVSISAAVQRFFSKSKCIACRYAGIFCHNRKNVLCCRAFKVNNTVVGGSSSDVPGFRLLLRHLRSVFRSQSILRCLFWTVPICHHQHPNAYHVLQQYHQHLIFAREFQIYQPLLWLLAGTNPVQNVYNTNLQLHQFHQYS